MTGKVRELADMRRRNVDVFCVSKITGGRAARLTALEQG